MTTGLEHRHAAHCESGVTASLLAHQGFPISEPMVFGIGSGLFFCYVPLVKIQEMPLISYRSYPGTIFRKVCKRLGVPYSSRSFLNRQKGIRELDTAIDRGTPVGLQTNIYWLTYFPQEFRHQFNGHNLIVTGRGEDEYAISDPVLQAPVTCPVESLNRARFARGPLSPRGRMYFPLAAPREDRLAAAVCTGLRDGINQMLRTPMFFVGVKGVRYLSRRVRAWPRTLAGPEQIKLHAGHIIRMQEEVGTGGAGFRFMYAAFLQEAGELLGHEPLLVASKKMTRLGGIWRDFAVSCARLIKGRDRGQVDCDTLADQLNECADGELEVMRFLRDNLPPDRA